MAFQTPTNITQLNNYTIQIICCPKANVCVKFNLEFKNTHYQVTQQISSEDDFLYFYTQYILNTRIQR